MNYVWSDNHPIAIHITEGDFSPSQLQSIANYEQLIVRDIRADAAGKFAPSVDYYPDDD